MGNSKSTPLGIITSIDMKFGTEEYWLGLNNKGERIDISHPELLKWCEKNGVEIGNSHVFDMAGERLVRGTQMITTARSEGWEDIATELETEGFVDS
jgi:hypothetical protein